MVLPLGYLCWLLSRLDNFCRTSFLGTLQAGLRNLSYRVVDGGQGGS